MIQHKKQNTWSKVIYKEGNKSELFREQTPYFASFLSKLKNIERCEKFSETN